MFGCYRKSTPAAVVVVFVVVVANFVRRVAKVRCERRTVGQGDFPLLLQQQGCQSWFFDHNTL